MEYDYRITFDGIDRSFKSFRVVLIQRAVSPRDAMYRIGNRSIYFNPETGYSNLGGGNGCTHSLHEWSVVSIRKSRAKRSR